MYGHRDWHRIIGGLVLLGGLWSTSATARVGVPVQLSWDYANISLEEGITVTGFQVQGCQVSVCLDACTPTDILGATTALDIHTWTDANVVAGGSYRYQVVAVGTINGEAARSEATIQVCAYVKATRRGRPGPSIFPKEP